MQFYKKSLVTLFCMTVLPSCTVFHTGCKKTDSYNESKHVQTDGTTVTHKDKVESDNNGNAVHTHTDRVDK